MGYSVKRANSRHRSWKLLLEENKYDAAGKRIKVCTAIRTEQLGVHGFREEISSLSPISRRVERP